MNWMELQTITLIATFAVVALYTHAAYRQAEGLLKPCLVPDFSEHREVQESANIRIFYLSTVLLRNIGSGPALNVRYELLTPEKNAAHKAYEGCRPASPIGPGGSFDTDTETRKLDKVVVFRAIYESLSGSRYESEGIIRDRRVVSTLKFGRVWWWQRRKPAFLLPVEASTPEQEPPKTSPAT